MRVQQSRKLANVCYDIRGPLMAESQRLERAGEKILRLNIGNPAPFGFTAAEEVLAEVRASLSQAQGYSDSQGLPSARAAVAEYHSQRGITAVGPEQVFLGNGVSELIVMALQALVNNGDEILIPAPDYPLWTAAVSLAGGRPVHYLCDESDAWQPNLDDLALKISPRTRAIVLINPNNPTGAVYTPAILEGVIELARTNGLILLNDEIYDQILYDEAVHTSAAALAPDLFCLTFNGLSKAYRLAGFRSGWLVLSGPQHHAQSYLEGLNILANMRLCANVPAQHAVAIALSGKYGPQDLILPGGRLREQRDIALGLLRKIPGVSCVSPKGALYLFPRLDPEIYVIPDDQSFMLELLREQRLLLVQGTGFNWPKSDHFRVVTLPNTADLEIAIGRLSDFLESRAT
ncbi:MAG: pyridoxal phosphate-dependent aminotransferase [Angustibacter sp.]